MNKSQLLQYLHHCLGQGRRRHPRDALIELADGLASRVLATRGLTAELSPADRVSLERQWGQPMLADEVARLMDATKRRPPDVGTFVEQSIEASLFFVDEPTGEDAEQAAKVRLLAAASLAFQAARDLSIGDIGVDQLIDDLAAGKGLPDGTDASEPLADWLERTVEFLDHYNPYLYEGNEDSFELDTLFSDEQPTLLADWIRRGGPSRGSTEADHEYLGRQVEAIRNIILDLPERLETLVQNESRRALHRAAEQNQTATSPPIFTPTMPDSAKIVPFADKFVTKQQQRKKWDQHRARQASWAYFVFAALLKEEHGVTTFGDIRQHHIECLDDFLLAVYPSYGKGSSDRDKSIAEVRRIAKKKSAPGLTITTRSRYMRFLQMLLEAAKASEDIDPKLNPLAFTGKSPVLPRDQRKIPKADAMAELFHAPVFVGCKSFDELDEPGPLVFHRAAYFGPMFAHYQGMRREEYCGLAVEDIVVDNGEFPYIFVVENEYRGLKNPHAVRNLSLHPELVRLGLLDYIEHLKALGIKRLFPDLYTPSTRSPLGDRFYDELKPIQERLGISPHHFRHFFNNELKQKRVSFEFRENMMGHRGRSETTERYCDPVLIELQREDLAKIELRTAHLEPKPIRLIPWVKSKRRYPTWARPNRSKPLGPAQTATRKNPA